MRNTLITVTLLVVLAVSSAQIRTITDVINSNPSFSTLSKLIQVTDLDFTLSQSDLYTVFAPNNTAFEALPASTVKFLLDPANVQLLREVLLYHVVPGSMTSTQLVFAQNQTLTSAQGSTIALDARAPFSSFASYVISLNDARVIKPNIQASNGIIHSVDRVIFSDFWQFGSPYPNLFGLISQDPSLTTLTYALKATGLDQVLTQLSATQFTVFAPTNKAFEDPLLAPLFASSARDTLKTVLLYHVLGAPVFSTDLYDGLTASTLSNGATLDIRRTLFLGNTVTTVNDATVLTTNTYAWNGVYHTVDRVLLPYTFFDHN